MIEIDMFARLNMATKSLRILALNSDNKMYQGEMKASAENTQLHIEDARGVNLDLWTRVLRVTDGAWPYPEIGDGLFTAVIRGFARAVGREGKGGSVETESGWDDMEWRIENNLRREGLNPDFISLALARPTGIYVPRRLDMSLRELVARAEAPAQAPIPPLRATVRAGDSTWNF